MTAVGSVLARRTDWLRCCDLVAQTRPAVQTAEPQTHEEPAVSGGLFLNLLSDGYLLVCRVRARASWWRWRESNPRPMTWNQGFSGRSLQLLFSAPALTQTRCGRAQSPKSPRSPGDEGYEQWLPR